MKHCNDLVLGYLRHNIGPNSFKGRLEFFSCIFFYFIVLFYFIIFFLFFAFQVTAADSRLPSRINLKGLYLQIMRSESEN